MSSEHDLTIERIYKAPIDLLFKAWTDESYLVEWWGPSGVTNPVCEFDAKVGGLINIVMLAGPELGEMAGNKWPLKGRVVEIVEPNKLVYIASPIFEGKKIMETTNTVTFESIDGDTTKLTLIIEVSDISEQAKGPLSGMKIGWNQSLDKLALLINK